MQQSPEQRVRVTKKSINFKKIGVQVLILTVFFTLGWGVGSNRITISSYSNFHRNVAQGGPSKLDYTSIDAVYNDIRQNFDGTLDTTKLTDGLKEGLTKATGDPYTEYFNVKDAKEFNNELGGTFSGIGAELSKDEKNNIVIIAPIAGYPADKAGLQPKDIIAEIDGQSAYDLSTTDAVNKIRGPVNTHVKLKIVRGDQSLDFDIMRQQITIPSVEHKILDGNVGYIKISRFGEDTADLTKQAAEEFQQKQVKGVVLDMRSDPGGLLDAAVSVSSQWLPSGTKVLDEKRGGKTIRTYTSSGNSPLKGIPTVVLINDGSASASEITAGALKDNKAATLVGIKSFGKGSVQQVINLSGGGILKVTTARWYRPNGENIDKKGIEPDQKVERTLDNIKAGVDPQLEAALTRF